MPENPPEFNSASDLSGSFCPLCGSPAQVERLLQGEGSQAERDEWAAHLEASPQCRLAEREDHQLRLLFQDYRADPFFTHLSAGWKPDLSKLKSVAVSGSASVANSSGLSKCDIQLQKGQIEAMKRDLKPEENLSTPSDFENVPELPRTTEAPAPAVRPLSVAARRRNLWPLVLVAGLVVLVIAGIVAVVVAGQSVSKDPGDPAVAATVAASQKLDLAYPGSDRLDIGVDEILAGSSSNDDLKNTTFTGSATTDDIPKIVAYYRKKLTDAGYTVLPAPVAACTPGQNGCPDTTSVNGTKGEIGVSVGIIGPNSIKEQLSKSASLTKLADKLKPNQNVIFALAGFPAPTSGLAAISPTPVASNSKAVFGPDNQLHLYTDSGLVSKGASAPVKSKDAQATASVDWLIADGNKTYLSLRLNRPNFSPTGSREDYAKPGTFGTLSDEKGKTYDLRAGGNSSDGKTQVWEVTAPVLPASVRKVTLKFGPGFPVEFSDGLDLPLITFKEANLPLATPFPGGLVEVKGVKLRVPYAYFGPDRTILLVNLDPSERKKATGDNTFAVVPVMTLPGAVSKTGYDLSVVDDQGQKLEPLPGNNIQASHYNPNGDSVLVLGPVKPGARKVTLSLDSLRANTHEEYKAGPDSDAATPIAAGPVYKVPLAELLKSRTSQPGISFELNGFKARMVSLQANLDSTGQNVELNLSYVADKAVPGPDGAVLQFISFVCPKCGTSTGNSSQGGSVVASSGAKLGAPGADPQPLSFTLRFKYDPAATEIELTAQNTQFTLPGAWQVTLAVPQK